VSTIRKRQKLGRIISREIRETNTRIGFQIMDNVTLRQGRLISSGKLVKAVVDFKANDFLFANAQGRENSGVFVFTQENREKLSSLIANDSCVLETQMDIVSSWQLQF